MREIKFRQWLSYNKTWHYFEFKNGMCSGVVNASLDSYPIMQYTGLKDKNGKKIYEGDICKHYLYSDKFEIAEIVFWEGAFIFKKYLIHDYALTKFAPCRSFEVIGNIYENSDLLK